jgi:predicted secreted protein
MRKNLWTFLFFLAWPLSGFALDIPVYTETNQKIVQNADHPQFVIQLKSDPATGYSWILKSFDPHYVKFIHHHYIPPQKVLPGSGGIEEWKFQLNKMAFVAPRTLSLKFVYARAWEAKPPLKIVVFQIATQ